MINLTKLRLAKGWSKQKLSFAAEISASDIGRFEAGTMSPYPNQLARLAKALGVEDLVAMAAGSENLIGPGKP